MFDYIIAAGPRNGADYYVVAPSMASEDEIASSPWNYISTGIKDSGESDSLNPINGTRVVLIVNCNYHLIMNSQVPFFFDPGSYILYTYIGDEMDESTQTPFEVLGYEDAKCNSGHVSDVNCSLSAVPCSGQGSCDAETGLCTCNSGAFWTDCSRGCGEMRVLTNRTGEIAADVPFGNGTRTTRGYSNCTWMVNVGSSDYHLVLSFNYFSLAASDSVGVEASTDGGSTFSSVLSFSSSSPPDLGQKLKTQSPLIRITFLSSDRMGNGFSMEYSSIYVGVTANSNHPNEGNNATLIMLCIIIPVCCLLFAVCAIVFLQIRKKRAIAKIQIEMAEEWETHNEQMIKDFTDKFISTPAVSVVETLKKMKQENKLKREDNDKLDSIIALIVSKKLFSLDTDFTTNKVIDKEAGEFLSDQFASDQKRTYTSRNEMEVKRICSSRNNSSLRIGNNLENNGNTSQTMFQSKQNSLNIIELTSSSTLATMSTNGKEVDDISTPHANSVNVLELLEVEQWISNLEQTGNAASLDMDTADFDAFAFQEQMGGSALRVLGFYLFKKHEFISAFSIDSSKLVRCLHLIEEGYQSNPYHNRTHATDVLQMTHWMLLRNPALSAAMSQLEKMALLFAAIAHDYKHPGVNNQFLVNTDSDLALIYNDVSVLEMSHASGAFSILRKEDANFLTCLDSSRQKQFRSLAIELILATDMSKHVDLLSDLKARLSSEKLDFSAIQTRLLMMKMILKVADVSNSARPWPVCRKWAMMVMEEFFTQGEKERSLKMPISAFMDREQTQIPKVCSLSFD